MEGKIFLAHRGIFNRRIRPNNFLLSIKVIISLWSFFITVLIDGIFPVNAQTDTRVYFSPSEGELVLNQENLVVMDVMIENVENLRGFLIKISYDPLIADLTSWSNNDGVIIGQLMEVIQYDGFLSVELVKLGGTAFNGNGKLLTLVFEGNRPGETTIEIEEIKLAIDANPNPYYSYPDFEDGLLKTSYNPSLLPHSSLSGQLILQGQPDASGVMLTLHPGESYAIGPYTTTTTASNGTFDFGDVVQDSYLLTTSHPGYLNLSADLGKFVTVSNDTTLNPLRLIGGNAIWQEEVNGEWVPNQEIDINDVALIAGEMYGQSGTGMPGDVNGDGVINIIDLALVKGNFGLTAADAYQSWQP